MSKSRYYTPEIEEFHVGFEYEIYEDWDVENGKSWHKQVYSNLTSNPERLEYVGGHMNKFRVKYLDKEDIEILGFIITEEWTKPYGYYLQGYIKHGVYKTELWYSFLKDKKGIYISLKTSHYNGNAKFYIKNKSELKKLLKQLNIEYNEKSN